jgi:hypothetical protein
VCVYVCTRIGGSAGPSVGTGDFHHPHDTNQPPNPQPEQNQKHKTKTNPQPKTQKQTQKPGGIPFGVIAVETRLVEQRIPADPANPESREALLPQAGQVCVCVWVGRSWGVCVWGGDGCRSMHGGMEIEYRVYHRHISVRPSFTPSSLAGISFPFPFSSSLLLDRPGFAAPLINNTQYPITHNNTQYTNQQNRCGTPTRRSRRRRPSRTSTAGRCE